MLFQLEFWHWWAIALILVVLEALSPSGLFVAMALSGTAVGAAFLLFPDLDVKTQLGIFGVLSLVFYGIFSRFFGKSRSRALAMKEKAQAMIGKDLVLSTPIRNNFGELEVDGEFWEIKGPDLPAGTKVRVVGIDGQMLNVYPLPNQEE